MPGLKHVAILGCIYSTKLLSANLEEWSFSQRCLLAFRERNDLHLGHLGMDLPFVSCSWVTARYLLPFHCRAEQLMLNQENSWAKPNRYKLFFLPMRMKGRRLLHPNSLGAGTVGKLHLIWESLYLRNCNKSWGAHTETAGIELALWNTEASSLSLWRSLSRLNRSSCEFRDRPELRFAPRSRSWAVTFLMDQEYLSECMCVCPVTWRHRGASFVGKSCALKAENLLHQSEKSWLLKGTCLQFLLAWVFLPSSLLWYEGSHVWYSLFLLPSLK